MHKIELSPQSLGPSHGIVSRLYFIVTTTSHLVHYEVLRIRASPSPSILKHLLAMHSVCRKRNSVTEAIGILYQQASRDHSIPIRTLSLNRATSFLLHRSTLFLPPDQCRMQIVILYRPRPGRKP